jgi:hypothetical protein
MVVVLAGVRLYAGPTRVDVRMGVRVYVDSAIGIGSGPGVVVDEDGVSSPAEACAVPAEAAERRSDGDDGTEADGSSDDEARTRSVEDDAGIVDRDVVEGGIEGLDFDVAAVVDDVVVGVGLEIAVAPGLLTEALDCIHDVGSLAEDGVAESAGPLGVACHYLEDAGEGQEGENAGIPREIVSLDGLGEGVAGEIVVQLGPGGGVGDLVPESGGGEDLGEQWVGIEGDSLDELVELLGSYGWRWRPLLLIGWRSLLLVLRLV